MGPTTAICEFPDQAKRPQMETASHRDAFFAGAPERLREVITLFTSCSNCLKCTAPFWNSSESKQEIVVLKDMKNYAWRRHSGGLLALSLACAVLFGALPQRTSAEPAETNAVAGPAVTVPQAQGTTSPAPNRKAVTRRLSGAELYSMHCNRCHPERYPTERTAAQWKTIMLHMRVRANLPGQQAKKILKYLQDNSGR